MAIESRPSARGGGGGARPVRILSDEVRPEAVANRRRGYPAGSALGILLAGADPGPRLARYARAHAAEFGPRLHVSRSISRLLAHRLVTETAALLLHRTPHLVARVIAYAGNAVTLHVALSPGTA